MSDNAAQKEKEVNSNPEYTTPVLNIEGTFASFALEIRVGPGCTGVCSRHVSVIS